MPVKRNYECIWKFHNGKFPPPTPFSFFLLHILFFIFLFLFFHRFSDVASLVPAFLRPLSFLWRLYKAVSSHEGK